MLRTARIASAELDHGEHDAEAYRHDRRQRGCRPVGARFQSPIAATSTTGNRGSTLAAPGTDAVEDAENRQRDEGKEHRNCRDDRSEDRDRTPGVHGQGPVGRSRVVGCRLGDAIGAPS